MDGEVEDVQLGLVQLVDHEADDAFAVLGLRALYHVLAGKPPYTFPTRSPAEVERVLSVLDGAVLVISAVEGVQPQTRILMRALQRLRIPTLLFVNKIDRAGADEDRVLRVVAERLGVAVVPMSTPGDLGTREAFVKAVADELTVKPTGEPRDDSDIARAIAHPPRATNSASPSPRLNAPAVVAPATTARTTSVAPASYS